MIIKSFYPFFISLGVTFFLIPYMRKVAFWVGAIDLPDGKVKFHKQPTPYLGGIALYVGFSVALYSTFSFDQSKMGFFFAGGTFLLLLGLFDDLVVMSPFQKLCGQLVAAACFLKAGYLFNPQFFQVFWHTPLFILWILTLINAFNLVDVMDGLATSIAIFATLSFAYLAILFHLQSLVIILLCLLGSLVAFLWYNRPNATIYMGDSGSLFIGGVLGALPLFFNWTEQSPLGYLSPILIFAVPLLEVGMLIIIRTSKKIPFYRGSPDHFCMYLLRKGWGKQQIILFVATFSCVLFIVALGLVHDCISLMALFIFVCVAFLLWSFIIFSPYLNVRPR